MSTRISSALGLIAGVGFFVTIASAPATAQSDALDFLRNSATCLTLLVENPDAYLRRCGGGASPPTGANTLAPTGVGPIGTPPDRPDYYVPCPTGGLSSLDLDLDDLDGRVRVAQYYPPCYIGGGGGGGG
jgi:hypothetical protein